METIADPNFSIVLPGPCNGKCHFCFWKREDAKYELSPEVFSMRLDYILQRLPSQFRQISITGGEPTMSPCFKSVLNVIRHRKARWPKVVLTTNGTGLRPDVNRFQDVVDHVNISRHGASDVVNNRIFGTIMPPLGLIECKIARLNRLGVDVTANCVLSPTLLHCDNFIKCMRGVGFSSVCFRKPHEEGCTLDPTPEEKLYKDWKVTGEYSCPVCRTKTQIIQGVTVSWKASIPEPSEGLDLIYEAILHPDGTLSADWRKNIIIDLDL